MVLEVVCGVRVAAARGRNAKIQGFAQWASYFYLIQDFFSYDNRTHSVHYQTRCRS